MTRWLILAVLVSGCSHTPGNVTTKRSAPGFFGLATLKAPAEICLQLRSEEPGLPAAESYECYKPGDPQYGEIRDHVGPIAVGEEKVIAPFK